MFKNKLCVLAVLLGCSVMANADITPSTSSKDARIQYVHYDPDNVVNIRAQVGRTTMIQLEQDERLIGDNAALGMGDGQAWNLSVKGNNIIFKPIAQSPNTNMIITTNKRTYAFYLSLARQVRKGQKHQAPTYILRFSYPDSQKAVMQAESLKQKQAKDILQSLPKQKDQANYNYWAQGTKALVPTAVFDNGLFTFFKFNDGRDLPTIYKVMPDGSEMLLNTHIEADTVIVHETAKKYMLRLGNSVLAVENRGFDEKGLFNRTGTSDQSSIRIVK
ncbi:P-type conjugative transfer protein VirB9 [Neisseria sp. Ec49-e6-T10]|uniref:P-type conjugative transfer protein VirB9 n=1 Tax=Neisseria sp. Ec49-e6-T10 TaxID=3140744 RepID=UPI003EB8C59E